MDQQQQQPPSENSDNDKNGLVDGKYEAIESLADLWLGAAEKKDMPFLRLYRLFSLIVIVIQFMVLSSVIFQNITEPPCRDLNFPVVATRLFVVISLAAAVPEEYFSKDVLGYYALSRMLRYENGIEDESFSAQVAYLLHLILQGFYFVTGVGPCLFGLLHMICDQFSIREIVLFLALGAYEYAVLLLVLIASVSVILLQCDAIDILFNFSGVLVVMQLDNIVFKLYHIKMKKMKKLQKYTEFQLTSAKLSLAGIVAVITFIYSFVIKT